MLSGRGKLCLGEVGGFTFCIIRRLRSPGQRISRLRPAGNDKNSRAPSEDVNSWPSEHRRMRSPITPYTALSLTRTV
jgi:hypothetical protein